MRVALAALTLLSGAQAQGSSSYDEAPIEPPTREVTRGSKTVKPDLATWSFVFSSGGSDKAFAPLRPAVEDLGRRLKDASGGAATVRPLGAAVGSGPELTVTADGVVELSLKEGLDFWERARLVAAVDSILRAVTQTARTGKGPKFSYQLVAITVKNPESFREELTRAWAQQVRSFIAAAAAPLQVTDCAAPGPVEATPRSLEQVDLSLSIDCRLSAGRSGGK
ncbi:MAG: hypothetical protein ACYC8T_26365 [Myxococcaceae bacterium]